MLILDPPNHGPDGPLQFPSFDALYAYIQAFSKDNGFAVSIQRRANYNRDRVATMVQLACSRGKKRESRSAGLRASFTARCDCPWVVVARAYAENAGAWTFRIKGQHNHGPSATPAAHPAHRQLTQEMMARIRTLSSRPAIRLRNIVNLLRDEYPDEIFTETDVKNYRQKLRREELGGRSPPQALVDFLRDNGIWHRAHLVDGRVEGLFWTLPECTKMWKRFPTTLGFNITCQNNRFKMPLFNLTGMTNLGTIFIAGWGLVGSERAESLRWLLMQLRALQQDQGIELPRVVLTTHDKDFKEALTELYPDVQQQICIFHINGDVRMQISKRWIGPNPDDENNTGEDNGAPAADNCEQGNDSVADAQPVGNLTANVLQLPGGRKAVESKKLLLPERFADLPRSPSGMMKLWMAMVYADEEDDFWRAWHGMQEVFECQEPILTYLADKWLPVRQEWAGCYISSYKNLGRRTTTPNESSTKMIKSYLITGTSTLRDAFNVLRELVDCQQRRYYEDTVRQRTRLQVRFQGPGKALIEDLAGQLSSIALDKVYTQFELVVASLRRSLADPDAPGLPPCRERLATQYGIPCQHILHRRLLADVKLSKYDFDPHWWLDGELPANAISLVREPLVVQGPRPAAQRAPSETETVE